MATQLLEVREVTVERTNQTGFKADSSWWTFSKFAQPDDVVMPSVGERVVVHLDKAGFVRKVEPTLPAATLAPASAAVRAIASHNAPEPRTGSLAGQTTAESPIAQDERGILATRLAILAAAVAILTSGGGATTDEDVLILAERLERWATR